MAGCAKGWRLSVDRLGLAEEPVMRAWMAAILLTCCAAAYGITNGGFEGEFSPEGLPAGWADNSSWAGARSASKVP